MFTVPHLGDAECIFLSIRLLLAGKKISFCECDIRFRPCIPPQQRISLWAVGVIILYKNKSLP